MYFSCYQNYFKDIYAQFLSKVSTDCQARNDNYINFIIRNEESRTSRISFTYSSTSLWILINLHTYYDILLDIVLAL